MARITGGEVWRPVKDAKNGRELATLGEPLLWGVEGPEGPTWIIVPEGFVTDFASVPRLFWSIFPPLGPWALAAILHDWLYQTCGEFGKYTRKQADEIFREAMEEIAKHREDGEPKAWKRALLYRAVRLGGGKGWGS